jgi:hypothetical protein
LIPAMHSVVPKVILQVLRQALAFGHRSKAAFVPVIRLLQRQQRLAAFGGGKGRRSWKIEIPRHVAGKREPYQFVPVRRVRTNIRLYLVVISTKDASRLLAGQRARY